MKVRLKVDAFILNARHKAGEILDVPALNYLVEPIEEKKGPPAGKEKETPTGKKPSADFLK